MLTFPTRSRHDVTDTARRRIWTSTCGRYRVVESRPRFRFRKITGYFAERNVTLEDGRVIWDWVKRYKTHRTRQAAEECCRKHERLTPVPSL